MPGTPRDRSTSDRLSGAVRRPSRCRSHTFTVPSAFESLLDIINRWIASCVMSRTEDSRGVPMHREESLISEYSNLRNLWETTLSARAGNTVTLNVSYLSGPERVESLIFSVNSPAPQERRARVREGSPDIYHFPGGVIGHDPIEGTEPPAFESTLPNISSAGGLANTLRQLISGADPTGSMRGAVQETFRSAYRTLSEGDDLIMAQGRITGFADTLARMAANFDERLISSTAIPLRPTIIPQDIPAGGATGAIGIIAFPDNPFFRQGYTEGFGYASTFLRDHYEQTRGVNEETGRSQPYASTFLLVYLKMTYALSQREIRLIRLHIYRGLVRDYLPDVYVLPNDLRSR